MDPSLLPDPKPTSRRQMIAVTSVLTLGLGAIGGFVWRERKRHPKLGQILHPPQEPSPREPETSTHPASLERPDPTKPTRQPLPREKDYSAFIATLDLRHISPREVISPHIRKRKGICNELPPREFWGRIVSTLQVADELRERLGVQLNYITSAYRCPSYNATLAGAASRSQHMQNRALDLVYDCDPKLAMKEALAMRQEGLFKGGLGLYPGFIHIDTRGRNATW